jgi:hypothetical protein
VVIAVYVPKELLDDMFGDVVEAARTSGDYFSSISLHNKGRNDGPIYICRNPKRPIPEVWAEWKMFL